MMTNMMRMVLATVLMTAMLTGCKNEPSEPKATTTLPADLMLAAEPADATGVPAVLAAKDGAKVTFRGRVGGRKEGAISTKRASMTLVDLSLKYCGEKDDCICPTPWDYCCHKPDLPSNTITVKVVGADGKTIPVSLKGVGGMKELSVVVVQGVVQVNDVGTRIVHVTGLYVMPE